MLLLASLGCVPATSWAQEASGPRNFAVVIGVSSVEGAPELTLEGAGSEATRVALALREEAGYTDVRIITDAEATKERIVATFRDDLAQKVTPQDTLMVYFVGHGVGGDFDDPYLLTYDTQPDDIPGTALSVAELGGQLSSWVPAGSYAIVTDASHAGDFNGVALLGPAASSWPDMGANTVLLSAAGLGSAASPGVFARHFTDAITGGADSSQDGSVSIAELYRYLVIAVPAETNGAQQPVMDGRFNQELSLAQGVQYKPLLSELNKDDPEVVYLTREVEVPGEVVIIREVGGPAEQVLPDFSVEKVKFVIKGVQEPVVACREQEPVACSGACYLRDVMAGPCTVSGFVGDAQVTTSVFIAARGVAGCSWSEANKEFVCRPPG